MTDNVTARNYVIHQGGSNPQFNYVAKAIWTIASKEDIHLMCHHIRGIYNVEADLLSRMDDPFNWRLDPLVFQNLDRHFGPHTIDRFADLNNQQLPRYNSRFADPDSEGVDALAQQNWIDENNYCCPPFRLIESVINCVVNQKADTTLIAPLWSAQPWYLRLIRLSTRAPVLIPNIPGMFQRMSRTCTPEPYRNRRWIIAAWRLSGKNG